MSPMIEVGNLSPAVTDDTPRPPFISVAQAARLLGVGESAVYAAVKRGDIEAVRIGKLIRIKRAPLLEQLGLPEDHPID